jgi:hypothetical protein
MIIAEISGPLLYRQKYLADDHRQDFRSFIIRTDRITSPMIIGEISVPYYTDRTTTPMIIGEKAVLYKDVNVIFQY